MEKYEEFQKVNDQNLINNRKDNVLVNNVCVITQKYTILEPINLLMAYRLSEKLPNIRCFMLIKCSEQKSRFKRYAIMSQ